MVVDASAIMAFFPSERRAFNNIKGISNYDALYIPLAVDKGMLLLRLDKRRKKHCFRTRC